jgi:phage minor structural protein
VLAEVHEVVGVMPEYKNTQNTIVLTSTWRCGTVTGSNGTQTWRIAEGPYADGNTVVFPVSIPHGALIKRAWVTIDPYAISTGAKYRHMNGYNIPASNIVELVQDAITPDTTMFEANFSFNVNGAVYQDTKQHTAYWRVENPTLHVEYYTDETEMPDIETVVDASGTSDNDPSDGRYLMPRLLDKNMAEKARLRPSKVSLELNLHPLSTAQMMLPDGETEVMVRDWVELFAPSGSVGVYRISETQKIRGNGGKVSVFLEHAFTTLADSLAAGVQAMTGSVAEVIATLLEAQTVKHWVLGDCDIPVDYEMIYEYVDDNLLKAVMSVVELLPEGYVLEFNTRVYPFVMHVRKVEDEAFCEARLSRNIASLQESIDAHDLCTRVYPYGAGEGTDRIELTGLTGQRYMDADTQDVWGIVERTFVEQDIYDAMLLKDVATKYLEKHKNPVHSIEIDGYDLSSVTGEELDRFRMGRMCRVPLPTYGAVINDRVIAKTYPDVYNQPTKVTVTLANKMRNIGDEIASLFREASNSKLLGGSVKSEEKTANTGGIYIDDPFAMFFEVKEYGNLVAVRLNYTCTVYGTAEKVGCRVYVDGQLLPDDEDKGGVVDVMRYLKRDSSGVIALGQHEIGLSPKGMPDDEHYVNARLVIKTVERKYSVPPDVENIMTDAFYTSDGKAFATYDGEMMHVQKGT